MTRIDFLAELLDSSTRAKIIRLFHATPSAVLTTEEIAKRLQIGSTKETETELKRLQKLQVVKSALCTREVVKNKKSRKARVSAWTGNESDYVKALNVFLRDTEPAPENSVLSKLKGVGAVKLVIASGFFASQKENPSRIDLLIVGDKLQERKIATALRTIEAQYGREIAYAVFSTQDFRYRLDIYDRLVRDVLDYPHHVLLDHLKIF